MQISMLLSASAKELHVWCSDSTHRPVAVLMALITWAKAHDHEAANLRDVAAALLLRRRLDRENSAWKSRVTFQKLPQSFADSAAEGQLCFR